MAKTFLELSNDILQQFNEVELTRDNFDSYRGVGRVAKSAVNKSIAKINHSRYNWPFNAAEHSVTLQKGVSEYAWPIDFKMADWRSFQIQRNDSLNIGPHNLRAMDRDDWYEDYRDNEYTGLPQFVFETHGNGFGVTPTPNENYSLKFRYYQTTKDLVNYDDETNIPDEYAYVIFTGALAQMYMFKNALDEANIANSMFEKYIYNMSSILLNQTNIIRDTRVGQR